MRCNPACGVILAACMFLGVGRAGAAPLTAFADFQQMGTSDLVTCQIKLTFGFEAGSLPPPTYLLATSVAAADLHAFLPFERRGFSYVSDYAVVKRAPSGGFATPKVLVVTPAEIHAILAAVATLPGVVDGGVDSSAGLSFALLSQRGGTVRCFESLLDAADATQLLVAMKHALVADVKAYDGVAEFACQFGWLGADSASLVPATAARIAVSELRRSGSKGAWKFRGTVTVTNVSSATLAPPLFVVLACQASDAELTGGSGSTCQIRPSGTPYLVLPVGGGLAPGRSVIVPVAFTSPLEDRIELTYEAPGGVAIAPRVFQGTGER